MAKPIYYLWIDRDTNMEELENEKQKFINAGFKVFLLDNTSNDDKFEIGLINIVKNHMK